MKDDNKPRHWQGEEMGQNPPQPGLPAQRAAPSRSRDLEGKEPSSHLLTSAAGLDTGDAVLRTHSHSTELSQEFGISSYHFRKLNEKNLSPHFKNKIPILRIKTELGLTRLQLPVNVRNLSKGMYLHSKLL